jgi:tetratricopeptide (TPR) repeat protein
MISTIMAITTENYLSVKGFKKTVRESAVRRSFAICALILCFLVSGCTTVTEEDLADLQSPNAVAKKEALDRISKGPGFPLNLMTPLLKRGNEENAITIMVKLLGGGKETKDTQLSIMKTLGHLGKNTKVPASPLIEKLKDKDPDIRREAIEALAKIKSQEGLAALVKLLDEERNKYAVIWALGEIGDPTAIPILSRLLANGDDYEKYNARKALEKMEERGAKGRRSSIAMAGGSAVAGVPPPSSQEREKVEVDKASDSHGSGKVLAKALDKAVSKPQDAHGRERQTGQGRVQKAGKKEKRPQQPLAVQRKQLLQALTMQRGPQKTAESAGVDPSQVVALASKETQVPEEATNMVLSAHGGQQEDTKKVKQTAGRGTSEKGATLYLDALAHHREGSLQKAKKLYEAALKSSPDLASAWNNLGAIYMKERNYRAAVSVLQKALRIKPNDADPYYNLACLYALQENVAQGLSYLKKAVSVDGEARKWAMTDADLKNLHGHSEYEEIIRETKS